jgi:hypothetical protein
MRRLSLFVSLLLVTAVIAVIVGATNSGGGAIATELPPTTSQPSAPVPLPTDNDVIKGPVTIPNDIAGAVTAWTTNWNRRTIDLDELKLGIRASDPRDLIRPLDSPSYESVQEAQDWLVDSEIGVLFELEDVARFYPLRILTSHEVVNDEAAPLNTRNQESRI